MTDAILDRIERRGDRLERRLVWGGGLLGLLMTVYQFV
jgi:hypothetical protein